MLRNGSEGKRQVDNLFSVLEALKKKDRSNMTEREAIKEHLRALTRENETLKSSLIRPSTVPSKEAYESNLKQLTTERAAVQKELVEVKHASESAGRELERVKKEYEAAERAGEGKDMNVDGDALRLKLYWDLGFVPVMDEDGQFRKMLINPEGSQPKVVNVEENNSFETTNLLWDLLS
ncbi:hypothetical protein BT69DRAFT_1301829 [Atractiella rhizophila]|nr:hypothetical protein BT69DRAFT_1301829 [Atractiella rhizophila]